jgi:hypothetical protein
MIDLIQQIEVLEIKLINFLNYVYLSLSFLI